MTSKSYYRPLVQTGMARPANGVVALDGWGWFTRAVHLRRDRAPEVVPAADIPKAWQDRITTPRASLGQGRLQDPLIMGILNVTPDSFSDGGRHFEPDAARAQALAMAQAGAGLIDIGGESTRPGAAFVPADEEIARTVPVIKALTDGGLDTAISIDTRKADVAAAALHAGATLVNDVSGFTFDDALAPLCARVNAPVCIMHSQGDPETMQNNPDYDDVLLDVFDFLDARIEALEKIGIPRSRIIVDPGIGFGKTLQHNLTLLEGISLFHGLGTAILLGVSRKGFIGRIGNMPQADHRFPGSIAVGLAALNQGVQILRVHDVAETAQAVALWAAIRDGDWCDG